MWKAFWAGGALREVAEVNRPVRPIVVRPSAMVWGVKLPWNLVATTALGLWLMFAPSALASFGLAAHSDHLVGALVHPVTPTSSSAFDRTWSPEVRADFSPSHRRTQ